MVDFLLSGSEFQFTFERHLNLGDKICIKDIEFEQDIYLKILCITFQLSYPEECMYWKTLLTL